MIILSFFTDGLSPQNPVRMEIRIYSKINESKKVPHNNQLELCKINMCSKTQYIQSLINQAIIVRLNKFMYLVP